MQLITLISMTWNTGSKPRQGKSHTITMAMTNKLTLILFSQNLLFGSTLQLLKQFEEHIDNTKGNVHIMQI